MSRNCHEEEDPEKVLGKLRSLGIRVTNQRKLIIFEILKFHGPFTTEELFQKLKKTGLDIATVYRSLTTFKEEGIVDYVDFSDGIGRYEYAHEGKHHHHIICNECKSVEPVHFCVIKGQEQLIGEMGYTQITHRLEFFGTCKSCAS